MAGEEKCLCEPTEGCLASLVIWEISLNCMIYHSFLSELFKKEKQKTLTVVKGGEHWTSRCWWELKMGYPLWKFNRANLYDRAFPIERYTQPGTGVHAYNPSTQEAEAGGLLVQDQPVLQSKTPISRKK
jgi:hypothetical protein